MAYRVTGDQLALSFVSERAGRVEERHGYLVNIVDHYDDLSGMCESEFLRWTVVVDGIEITLDGMATSPCPHGYVFYTCDFPAEQIHAIYRSDFKVLS